MDGRDDLTKIKNSRAQMKCQIVSQTIRSEKSQLSYSNKKKAQKND